MLKKIIPQQLRKNKALHLTALVNGISFFKIPLLAFCTPKIVRLDEERSEVLVRLDFRTRNHLNVMYFGALAMGAELSIALQAIESIRLSKQKIDFIFKDFKSSFLKRADGHVHFICEDVSKVAAMIDKASKSGERFEGTYKGYAIVEGQSEPVMKYELTLSVKNRSIK